VTLSQGLERVCARGLISWIKESYQMPIPDYQSIMLPLLEYLADQQEHSSREVIDSLAASFELCEAEKQKL